ncbi:MAG: hypothetical protein ACYDB7_15415, partial [Mycobacteriales bacterium]
MLRVAVLTALADREARSAADALAAFLGAAAGVTVIEAPLAAARTVGPAAGVAVVLTDVPPGGGG